MQKKRYAQVGVGGRSMMYSEAVIETYRENSELVALCDNNPGRLRQRAEWGRKHGVDVITEEAMTTTEQRCQHILDTRHSTGRTCRVTFNYRYSPPSTQVKDLLMSGVIGIFYRLKGRHGAHLPGIGVYQRGRHGSRGVHFRKVVRDKSDFVPPEEFESSFWP